MRAVFFFSIVRASAFLLSTNWLYLLYCAIEREIAVCENEQPIEWRFIECIENVAYLVTKHLYQSMSWKSIKRKSTNHCTMFCLILLRCSISNEYCSLSSLENLFYAMNGIDLLSVATATTYVANDYHR